MVGPQLPSKKLREPMWVKSKSWFRSPLLLLLPTNAVDWRSLSRQCSLTEWLLGHVVFGDWPAVASRRGRWRRSSACSNYYNQVECFVPPIRSSKQNKTQYAMVFLAKKEHNDGSRRAGFFVLARGPISSSRKNQRPWNGTTAAVGWLPSLWKRKNNNMPMFDEEFQRINLFVTIRPAPKFAPEECMSSYRQEFESRIDANTSNFPNHHIQTSYRKVGISITTASGKNN